MNIIIPIGGTGQRFAVKGYRKPKPLVNVLGKPILFWNLEHLQVQPPDTVFIVYREEFKQHDFEQRIAKRFQNYRFRFIPLKGDTGGASETVLFALKEMDHHELSQPTLVVDADNFYPEDILEMARAKRTNLIFFKKDYNKNPIYSYISLDGDKVTDIREKVKISDNACVGAYGFQSGLILMDTIHEVLRLGKKQQNEYYISALYDHMIGKGVEVSGQELEDFICLGTPEQVKSFTQKTHPASGKYRFTLIPDDRIITPDRDSFAADFTGYMRKLAEMGHQIIIYAPKLTTGYVGSSDSSLKTICSLFDGFGVKYSIVDQKPDDDFFIDAGRYRSISEIEKETGFYF